MKQKTYLPNYLRLSQSLNPVFPYKPIVLSGRCGGHCSEAILHFLKLMVVAWCWDMMGINLQHRWRWTSSIRNHRATNTVHGGQFHLSKFNCDQQKNFKKALRKSHIKVNFQIWVQRPSGQRLVARRYHLLIKLFFAYSTLLLVPK